MKRTTEANTDWITLVGAVLFGVPRLDGAACSERHELFDPAPQGESSDNTQHRYAAAVA
ncbi:MAG: hypothetical protein INR66_21020, partial [Gordonia polyisoprenivorans]|nr:hypothetical protein [Gordonia polyisoprenivorans]